MNTADRFSSLKPDERFHLAFAVGKATQARWGGKPRMAAPVGARQLPALRICCAAGFCDLDETGFSTIEESQGWMFTPTDEGIAAVEDYRPFTTEHCIQMWSLNPPGLGVLAGFIREHMYLPVRVEGKKLIVEREGKKIYEHDSSQPDTYRVEVVGWIAGQIGVALL